MLPGFSKNLLAAVKTIETIIGSFKSRVRTIENNLWKEFQNLEHTLDVRTKKLDRLETIIKTGGIASMDSKAEMQKLKEANRLLKEQLASLRNVDARTRRLEPAFDPGSPSPSVPMGPRSLNSERTATLTRHHTTTAVETLDRPFTSASSLKPPSTSNGGTSNDEASEQRWIFRLRELERRLKAEREARLLDRSGARKRLEEGERRNEELKAELERQKIRKETALH
jgi:hypothetical protein